MAVTWNLKQEESLQKSQKITRTTDWIKVPRICRNKERLTKYLEGKFCKMKNKSQTKRQSIIINIKETLISMSIISKKIKWNYVVQNKMTKRDNIFFTYLLLLVIFSSLGAGDWRNCSSWDWIKGVIDFFIIIGAR